MRAFDFGSNCVELNVPFRPHGDCFAFPKEYKMSGNGSFIDAEDLDELLGGQFTSEHQVEHSQSNWVCEGQQGACKLTS